MALAVLRARDQYVLRFYVSVNNLKGVKVLEAGCDLTQCMFRFKRDHNLHKVDRAFNDVGKGRRAEFNGNVEEIRPSLLIEVPDDIGMVIGFLEDADFSGGQSDKILEEPFDGDSTAL